MITIPTILAIVAGVIAAYELIRSQGRNLLAWAILALAFAHLWGVVVT